MPTDTGSKASYKSASTLMSAHPTLNWPDHQAADCRNAKRGHLLTDSDLQCCRSDVDLEITRWDVQESSLEAHWRFSAVLDLPWRPRLAAAGKELLLAGVAEPRACG